MHNSPFILLVIISAMMFAVTVTAQSLDGSPYDPETDPDIDMYLCTWKTSMPATTHGSLIEREIFTKGDALDPPQKGAVFDFLNRFSYATLDAGASTAPTTLEGEQEVIYILGGEGEVAWNGKTQALYPGMAMLIPADCEFTMTAAQADSLTMYLVNEPTPDGFRPNEDITFADENTTPIQSTTGHWCHIVKNLFETDAGLGTLERVLTVSFDPMTIGHPHSHTLGTEEVWAQITGTSVAFIGKEIRMQEPGMAYMIPPDGNTPHSNINTTDTQQKMFYFARYKDHEVRP